MKLLDKLEWYEKNEEMISSSIAGEAVIKLREQEVLIKKLTDELKVLRPAVYPHYG